MILKRQNSHTVYLAQSFYKQDILPLTVCFF